MKKKLYICLQTSELNGKKHRVGDILDFEPNGPVDDPRWAFFDGSKIEGTCELLDYVNVNSESNLAFCYRTSTGQHFVIRARCGINRADLQVIDPEILKKPAKHEVLGKGEVPVQKRESQGHLHWKKPWPGSSWHPARDSRSGKPDPAYTGEIGSSQKVQESNVRSLNHETIIDVPFRGKKKP